jgi:hypothetical protein
MATVRTAAFVPLLLPIFLLPHLAAADGEIQCHLTGQVADIQNGGAVEGAHVQISDHSGLREATVTDRAGHYEVYVRPGDYDVVFEYGKSRTGNHVSVTSSCIATLDGRVDRTGGEVIVIQDQKPPRVPARPSNYSPRKAPPYSDEALDKDAWTRAWVLLDVGPDGQVTQFKFLKRPGYDLENIAASELFKLTFDPARDDRDQPTRTFLIWGIEWTSNSWLMAMNLPRTMTPPIVGFPPRATSETVPCKGSGPMHLGSVHPGYRDCSEPDLTQVAREPWIVRP